MPAPGPTAPAEPKSHHAEALAQEVCRQAAAILRTRLRVVSSAVAVKAYMDQDNAGLNMRVGLVDVTMPPEVQTSGVSRRVSKQPKASTLKSLGQDVTLPPATPVIGNLLIRHALMNMEPFYAEIERTHPHKRSLHVCP